MKISKKETSQPSLWKHLNSNRILEYHQGLSEKESPFLLHKKRVFLDTLLFNWLDYRIITQVILRVDL